MHVPNSFYERVEKKKTDKQNNVVGFGYVDLWDTLATILFYTTNTPVYRTPLGIVFFHLPDVLEKWKTCTTNRLRMYEGTFVTTLKKQK